MSKKKNEIINPISYCPLSQIENPVAMLVEPGDEITIKITKKGTKSIKMNAGGIKRSSLQYKTGTVVEHTSSKNHKKKGAK